MVLPLALALPKCVHLPYLRHVSLVTKVYGLQQLIILSMDESRRYLGFSTVTPLQRFPFGRDNLNNILVRPFKFVMWVYMGNVTNTIVL